MARRNFEYRTGEWEGPENVFTIDRVIDARLEAMAEQFSEQKPPPDTLYAHADGDIRSNYDKARKEVLDAKNFHKEKRDRIEELLESLAVVKWGYCGPLESRSLCDAFDVTGTFGFEWDG